METQTITQQQIEDRLTVVAEHLYPITDDMCPHKKIGAKNSRWAFMRQKVKDFAGIQSDKLKMIVLNELETKAGCSKTV